MPTARSTTKNNNGDTRESRQQRIVKLLQRRAIKSQAELQDLRRSLEREVKKIAQSLKNEVVVARARENTLAKNVSQLEGQSNRHQKAQIRLREFEREAKANRPPYENFLSRFKETGQQQDLQQADARIISRAEPPAEPSFPNRSPERTAKSAW